MGSEGEASATILVVADDADKRNTLVEILELYGYEAVAVKDGDEALEHLETRPLPCLILLDVMPLETDSYELMTLLKTDPRLARLPVVLLTGTANVDAFSRFTGVVFCLSKPVEVSTLLKVVGIHCRRLAPARVASDRT